MCWVLLTYKLGTPLSLLTYTTIHTKSAIRYRLNIVHVAAGRHDRNKSQTSYSDRCGPGPRPATTAGRYLPILISQQPTPRPWKSSPAFPNSTLLKKEASRTIYREALPCGQGLSLQSAQGLPGNSVRLRTIAAEARL
jgi:hypothetical protein